VRSALIVALGMRKRARRRCRQERNKAAREKIVRGGDNAENECGSTLARQRSRSRKQTLRVADRKRSFACTLHTGA